MKINYDTRVCPYCGNKAKRPFTGNVSSVDLIIDDYHCLIHEVVNENDEIISYDIYCKNNKHS